MSVLKPDVNSLEALEIVQVEINTKYNNVNVLQAVALNLIFADKNSNQNLGWKPSVTFEEGLFKTIDWYFNNKEWLDNVTSGDYQNYYKSHYK